VSTAHARLADLGDGGHSPGRLSGLRLQPGPLLFERSPDLVWGLIASLYIGNVMLLILNLPLAPLWVRLLMIPRPYLYGGIMVFAFPGAYAANGSVADLVLLLVIGLVGYVMRVYDFPVAPVLVGMILGPSPSSNCAAPWPSARAIRPSSSRARSRRGCWSSRSRSSSFRSPCASPATKNR
jgi:hypothetical protein